MGEEEEEEKEGENFVGVAVVWKMAAAGAQESRGSREGGGRFKEDGSGRRDR